MNFSWDVSSNKVSLIRYLFCDYSRYQNYDRHPGLSSVAPLSTYHSPSEQVLP